MTTGPVFNNPKAPDTAGQNAILGHLGRLTGGALPGSTVRISIYSLRSDWYAGKLAEAHRNGVNVQVLVDHTSIEADGSGATPGLKVKNTWTPRSPRPHPPGRPTAPPGSGSARRTRLPGEDAEQYAPFSNNHNKFFLFSRTTGSGSPTLGVPLDDVTVQSSGNLTVWDLKYGWNDAMTVVGNAELHAAYRTYFEKLTASQAAPDGSLQTKDYPSRCRPGRPGLLLPARHLRPDRGPPQHGGRPDRHCPGLLLATPGPPRTPRAAPSSGSPSTRSRGRPSRRSSGSWPRPAATWTSSTACSTTGTPPARSATSASG
ncbi:hypothetical protein GCM10020229_65970 [Kitasatospora albolonga]|uniref:phospholipase D-like domain-containing protein n=1 Tax=Kitasatospora albolonga TaxID=68173 RepID=UPI0031F1BF4B